MIKICPHVTTRLAAEQTPRILISADSEVRHDGARGARLWVVDMADLSWITTLVKKVLSWSPRRAPPSPSPQLLSGSPDLPGPSVPWTSSLERLRWMVARIRAVLSDAEETEIQDESVRRWLKDLRGVAYEAEDMLDEYEYELLRIDVHGHVPPREGRRTRRYVIGGTTSPRLDAASVWFDTRDKIRKIQEKLEEISKVRDTWQWSAGDGWEHPPSTAMHLPTIPPLDIETKPKGREEDLKNVTSMLLSEECTGRSDLFVVSIVGIGGVGKTTLAQLVYDNSEICGLFELKGWVSVSEDFDLVQLTRKICRAFSKSAGQELEVNELSVLHRKLIDMIEGRRFLLVLDDVWNENQDLWDRLLLPLKYGMPGSAVITTTRSQNVARVMAAPWFHHHLNCLSKEDCWDLLKQHAFHGQDAAEKNFPELVDIAEQIADNCKGLPLAAVSLGRLLCHYGSDVTSWRCVLESNLWDVDDKIIPALMLSYVHLPGHLKPCFVYASLFPKDEDFNRDELVQLWMAQGYIRQSRNREPEAVGNSYFDELLNRSFFQTSPTNRYRFAMHDLIHDLAQSVSQGEHVVMDMRKAKPGTSLHVAEARHLLVQGSKDDTASAGHDLSCPPHEALRTLLVLEAASARYDQVQPAFITTKMLNLRVLSVRDASIDHLPRAIGYLKHLRYLNLEDNEIRVLPDSIGELYHLQTLLLSRNKLQALPTSIANLANLRCLEVKGNMDMDQMPRGFGRLASLRSLDRFSAGLGVGVGVGLLREDCAGVEELKNLKHLRGYLMIDNLLHIVDPEKAKEADLEGKEMISHLVFNWRARIRDGQPSISRGLRMENEVFENLRPHVSLKQLDIWSYPGDLLPEWMGDGRFHRLATVQIEGPYSVALPSLGHLPSLRYLCIRDAHELPVVGSEFHGREAVGFPALDELAFYGMPKLVEWRGARGSVDFPRLRRLELHDCPRLKRIVPLYLLPSLEYVCMMSLRELTCIELQSPCSSSSSPSPSLPSLELIRIRDCPRAYFSVEDGEQLRLPPAVRDFHIEGCFLLVEWCRTEQGIRSLARIPGVELFRDRTTDEFSPSNELDEGGHGFVYRGTLPDGRTIAIKRLYENSCRPTELFWNEVAILSSLHHPNLVALYGRTTCHSRELLLVYEFVPTDTIADHLHEHRAAKGALAWPLSPHYALPLQPSTGASFPHHHGSSLCSSPRSECPLLQLLEKVPGLGVGCGRWRSCRHPVAFRCRVRQVALPNRAQEGHRVWCAAGRNRAVVT
ncbi:hypothetical protein Taro_020787 [Colocasia esculenta]|uniref:Protein kinase domain-containing protein n=1 Tax=Colocasia esculenta TaxID=4460 RepID=A0A843UZP8_COLES|nr:hypothetical protein [Colocasia esculenta]